jgi:hypothetical protein
MVPWDRLPAWKTASNKFSPLTLTEVAAFGGDFFIANHRPAPILTASFSDTTAMIVVTSCLRATYANRPLWARLLKTLLNLPVFRRPGRGIPAVYEKYTETPSGYGTHSARAAGAMSAPLPFQLRGKHPRREERAPRFTCHPSNTDRSNELTSIWSASPPSWRSFARFFHLLLTVPAHGRPLQSHPRAPQAGWLLG